MLVAFTSCCDVINDPEQSAWSELIVHNPSRIILLGDTIYMDYGLGDHLANGEPQSLQLADFSKLMHDHYSRQWEVAAFRHAIDQTVVDVIWDDHDFAWNNARGIGSAGDPEYVPSEYRRLSRMLFEQFRDAVITKPTAYPANLYRNGLVATDLGGIQQELDLAPDIRLHLLDGRSFREPRSKTSSLLGLTQRTTLETRLLPQPAVNILACGTTLKDWKRYSDYKWLRDQSDLHRIIYLSGDVHEYDFREHGRLFEATASAMAQPPGLTATFGKKTGVFGLLQMDTSNITIMLWHRNREQERQIIDRASWTLST